MLSSNPQRSKGARGVDRPANPVSSWYFFKKKFQNERGITFGVPEHAEAFFAKAQALSDAVLTELNASKGVEIPLVVGHCPVNAIREVKEDGEDAYLGDISLRRCTDLRLLGALVDDHTDDEGKNRLASQNSRRNVGDPEIIWTIGCTYANVSIAAPLT